LSLSPLPYFICSEWGKKRWVRGDAPSGWDHVLSPRRQRRFRATCCQHLQEPKCLGNIAYEWSFNRTPVFRIRVRTFSAPHCHNESRPSFVVSSLHQHYDARRHCWASIPCCAPPPPPNHHGKFYARKHKESNPPSHPPHAPPTNHRFLPHRQHAREYICNPFGTQNYKFIRNNTANRYLFLS
jgi:hypothetical protein